MLDFGNKWTSALCRDDWREFAKNPDIGLALIHIWKICSHPLLDLSQGIRQSRQQYKCVALASQLKGIVWVLYSRQPKNSKYCLKLNNYSHNHDLTLNSDLRDLHLHGLHIYPNHSLLQSGGAWRSLGGWWSCSAPSLNACRALVQAAATAHHHWSCTRTKPGCYLSSRSWVCKACSASSTWSWRTWWHLLLPLTSCS